MERYDDRDDIRCNLIESYDRLMGFIAKHLNEIFYLEGTVRVNVRDKLFREVIANLLIHREYSNAYPAKLIIEHDKVITENANKAHYYGNIDVDNFSPFPKNPAIARVFKEIGWAEELGSGVKNIKKYMNIYSNKTPIFIEDDIFKTIIEINSEKADIKPINSEKADIKKVIDFLKEHHTITNMQVRGILHIAESTAKRLLNHLVASGILVANGDKKGRYYTLTEL